MVIIKPFQVDPRLTLKFRICFWNYPKTKTCSMLKVRLEAAAHLSRPIPGFWDLGQRYLGVSLINRRSDTAHFLSYAPVRAHQTSIITVEFYSHTVASRLILDAKTFVKLLDKDLLQKEEDRPISVFFLLVRSNINCSALREPERPSTESSMCITCRARFAFAKWIDTIF